MINEAEAGSTCHLHYNMKILRTPHHPKGISFDFDDDDDDDDDDDFEGLFAFFPLTHSFGKSSPSDYLRRKKIGQVSSPRQSRKPLRVDGRDVSPNDPRAQIIIAPRSSVRRTL